MTGPNHLHIVDAAAVPVVLGAKYFEKAERKAWNSIILPVLPSFFTNFFFFRLSGYCPYRRSWSVGYHDQLPRPSITSETLGPRDELRSHAGLSWYLLETHQSIYRNVGEKGWTNHRPIIVLLPFGVCVFLLLQLLSIIQTNLFFSIFRFDVMGDLAWVGEKHPFWYINYRTNGKMCRFNSRFEMMQATRDANDHISTTRGSA